MNGLADVTDPSYALGTLVCPRCNGEHCHRSRRRGVVDYAIGLFSLRPWRCPHCERRFYGKTVPLRYFLRVHCSLCGNLNVQQISRDHMRGVKASILRLANIPVYRCTPCRYRFFSVRAWRPVRQREDRGGNARPETQADTAPAGRRAP